MRRAVSFDAVICSINAYLLNNFLLSASAHAQFSAHVSERWLFLQQPGLLTAAKDYRNTKTVHSYTYEWEKVQRAIWQDSPAF